MGKANIAADLVALAKPIGSLQLLPGNPRKGDVEAVKRSYERFGQRKPIVANRDGVVIAGNHQLKAAAALGWEEIAVVFVDDDEQTAKAFALADNRISDLGSYDLDSLAALLSEIASDTDLLLDTGYDETFLNGLLALNSDEESDEISEFPVVDPKTIETAYACPSCGYEWSGNPRPGSATHEPEE